MNNAEPTFWPILGVLFLIFRIWIGFKKLKTDVHYRFERNHLSRILTIIFAVSMILNFSNNVFTLIVWVALPTMIYAFLFSDIPFYIEILNKDVREKNPTFLIFAERVTLHPPLIIAGFYFWFLDPHYFFPLPNWGSIIAGVVLSWVMYILFDPRFLKKKDGIKQAIFIITAAVVESILLLTYLTMVLGLPTFTSLTDVNLWYPVIGSILFIFRGWLVEGKLKETLDYRRHYLSRITNFLYCIAMILEFKNTFFNLIIYISFPMQVISFLTYDMLFFKKIIDKKISEQLIQLEGNTDNLKWLIIERLTLHPPLIISGLIIYLNDPRIYFANVSPIDIIALLILTFTSFFIFDKRSRDVVKIKSTGFWILFGIICSITGSLIYLFI